MHSSAGFLIINVNLLSRIRLKIERDEEEGEYNKYLEHLTHSVWSLLLKHQKDIAVCYCRVTY